MRECGHSSPAMYPNDSSMRLLNDLKKLLALSLFTGLGFAWQYPGQYPPGQYPPGQYPPGQGGQGPGIPFPRRGKKTSDKDAAKNAEQPLHFMGKVRAVEAKHFEVDAPDTRTLVFQINDQTKKPDGLAPGDEVDVDARQDDKGYYVALTVTRTGTAHAEKSSPQQTATDKPEVEPSGTGPVDTGITIQRGPKYEPGDEGPPKLKRGKPVGAPHKEPVEDAALLQTAGVAAESQPDHGSEPHPAPAVATQPETRQAFIDKAREAAGGFLTGLPNYMTTQHTTRYVSEGHGNSWHAMDVVSVDVVFEGGKEKYGNLAINGKPSKQSPEESGAWSTGEFGTILLDLFSPATAADFRYRRSDTVNGFSASVYDFTVERSNSHWKVDYRSQYIFPAYRGTIWIDKNSARAVRIEMQAKDLPKEFPADAVENAVDYQMVSLGTEKYLLPVQAEILSCERGASTCSKNIIEFRNYHKFTGESVIKYTP